MSISLKNVNKIYKIGDVETYALRNVSLEIKEGEFVGIVGPNGCGKSTLLKNIYRVYRPKFGDIFIDGEEIQKLSSRKIARKMAVMVQENNVEFDISVLNMVLLGRYAHKKILEDDSPKDIEIARESLKKVGLEKYEDRSFLNLSGGEKQRVLIARVIAQQSKFIILDEPTNHLDIRYQFQIMNIVSSADITVLASIHDLNMAALYCDMIFIMYEGEIIDYGSPQRVITTEMIKKVFGVNSIIEPNPVTKKVNVVYVP